MSTPITLAPEQKREVVRLLDEINDGFSEAYDELPKSVVEDDEERGEQLSLGFRKPFGELCEILGVTMRDLVDEGRRAK